MPATDAEVKMRQEREWLRHSLRIIYIFRPKFPNERRRPCLVCPKGSTAMRFVKFRSPQDIKSAQLSETAFVALAYNYYRSIILFWSLPMVSIRPATVADAPLLT